LSDLSVLLMRGSVKDGTLASPEDSG